MSDLYRTMVRGFQIELLGPPPNPNAPSQTMIVASSISSDPRPGQGSQLSTAGIAALLNSAAGYYNATNVAVIRGQGSQNLPEIIVHPFGFRMSVSGADAVTQYNAIVTALQTAANIN